MTGTIPASSQASRLLSTASLTVVKSALRGLSNPSRCRFLVKNSLTEMLRCWAAIDSAVARFRFFVDPSEPLKIHSPPVRVLNSGLRHHPRIFFIHEFFEPGSQNKWRRFRCTWPIQCI